MEPWVKYWAAITGGSFVVTLGFLWLLTRGGK